MPLRHWIGPVLAAVAVSAQAADGLVTQKSRFGVEETEQRLLRALEEKGMNVVARVDHAAAAEEAGLKLGPTRLVIFGNPEVGTRLMQCQRSAAIDLPMKALIWEDQEGVWLGYNSAGYLADRHGIDGCEDALSKVRKALGGFAEAATKE